MKTIEVSVAKLGMLISVVAISCFCIGLTLGVGKTQVYALQNTQNMQNTQEIPIYTEVSGEGIERPDDEQKYSYNWGVNGKAKLRKLCKILVNKNVITQNNMDEVMAAQKKTDG